MMFKIVTPSTATAVPMMKKRKLILRSSLILVPSIIMMPAKFLVFFVTNRGCYFKPIIVDYVLSWKEAYGIYY